MGSIKLPFYARLTLILLSVALVYNMLIEAKDILIPLVFALLVAVLLFPLTRFFENKLHMPRSLAALFSVVLFMAALVGFTYFFIIQVVGFSEDFPVLKTRFQRIYHDIQHWFSFKLHINSSDQMDYIRKSTNGIITSAAESVSNIFHSLATLVVWTVFIFIFTFFILYHRNLIIKFVTHLFSEQNKDKVREVILETKGIINNYVSGLLIEMILVGVVNCTMFEIMGLKYAMLLGIMAAVLNIIPYLGIYTSMAITMLVTFAYSSTNLALEAGIGLFVVHLLDSNILMPRIVGGRVKMNSFITILAVVIGNMVWGVPGMFLFIPLAGIMKLICERVVGLEAWAILMGVEEKIAKMKVKKIKLVDVDKGEGEPNKEQ